MYKTKDGDKVSEMRIFIMDVYINENEKSN